MTHEAMLIEALCDPAAYPQRPHRVDFLQTHISLLFFAGDRVYKVKKPVDLGFLDYTTLEQRRFFCEEEVRLNRRLAPSVYRGMVRIVRDQSGTVRVVTDDEDADGNERGQTIDYAVEMVRLPDDRMLPRLIERDAVGESEMRGIAERLARFHATCPTGNEINRHATVEELCRQMRENIEQLRRFMASDSLDGELIEHTARWCEAFLDEHAALIRKRIEHGRVREGHGDLHAGNICLLQDEIIIYDCIEFTPKFRCRDVASELGFLMMDLEYRGHAELGRAMIERYAAVADDAELFELLDFFKVHFAIVRAKVAAIKSEEAEVEPDERQAAASEARQYLHLAVGYTVSPALVMMCGLPATGKSTIARSLARPLVASVFRSDAIRKQLAGLEPTDRSDETIYTGALTDRTYERMGERVRQSLDADRSAVADATFGSERRRKQMISTASAAETPWVLVHTIANEKTIRQRMDARAADDREISDAGWTVYCRMRSRFEQPDEIDPEHVVIVDEGAEMQDVMAQVLSRLVGQ